MAASVLVFVLGGLWVDRKAGTAPAFQMLGIALALLAVAYHLYKLYLMTSGPKR